MQLHSPSPELIALPIPSEPPSKPEARPPPTALLTSDDWEALLGGCEMGNVLEACRDDREASR